MTLVELLVVIAILGMLAALLLPTVGRVSRKGKVQQARMEIEQLVTALREYESFYGRFPVSDEALQAATASGEDVTYGGVIEQTGTWVAGPNPYLTNNAEPMAALLDLECYGDGAPTMNQGHVKNPRAHRFLEPRMPRGTNAAPGVGIDGVYRDPWGSPYVISLDVHGAGRARDALYGQPQVSEDPRHPGEGLKGLVRTVDEAGRVWFAAAAPVMVWSAGPDRRLSTTDKANAGDNRDNVLSWSR